MPCPGCEKKLNKKRSAMLGQGRGQGEAAAAAAAPPHGALRCCHAWSDVMFGNVCNVHNVMYVRTYVRTCSVSLSVFASHPLCLRARRRPHRHRCPGKSGIPRCPGKSARATRCDFRPGSSEHAAALARLFTATSQFVAKLMPLKTSPAQQPVRRVAWRAHLAARWAHQAALPAHLAARWAH